MSAWERSEETDDEPATAARDTHGVMLIALVVVDQKSERELTVFVTRKQWREVQDARCYYNAVNGRHHFRGRGNRCLGCEVIK